MKTSKKTAIGLLVIVVLVTGIVLVVSALTEEGSMDDGMDDGMQGDNMDDGMEDDKMDDGMEGDTMDDGMEDDKMGDGMEGDDKMENDAEESPFPALLAAGGIFGALVLARRMSG